MGNVVRVEIVRTDLPGRTCGPLPEARVYDNVRLGMGRHPGVASLVPGDARQARWSTDVTVKRRTIAASISAARTSTADAAIASSISAGEN